MHECGDSLLMNLNPKQARPGIFVERHSCPLCRSIFEVTFEGAAGDEEISCHVIRVAKHLETKFSMGARAS